MFFLLSKILDVLISPFSWCLIFLFAGVILNKPQQKKNAILTALIMLLVFSNPWLINQVTKSWEVSPRNANEITVPYDVGIVMGGSMRYYDKVTDRVIYSSSVDRLIQALELYHDGHIKKILLTGGSGFVNFQEWKESGLISKVLLKSGVKAEDIILENNSRNTYENALMSTGILKKRNYGSRYLLITSGTHMRRSLACFEKAGLKLDSFSVDVRSISGINTLDKIIQPDAENLWAWDVLTHEWFGMITYKMMGYI